MITFGTSFLLIFWLVLGSVLWSFQDHFHLDLELRMLIPKASFFRSMAGGVPSGATEGSSMGPEVHDSFLHFRDHFQDPFPEHFFMIFGPRNGSQNHPKMVPKSFHF